ncbi:MAG: alkaline phosphatase D family protein [Pseudomonadota bacterium]
MRIAFTSCTCWGLVKTQPVWDYIREAAPDHVVLLGDNIYNDVPSTSMSELQEMYPNQFAAHMYKRYEQQLANQKFRDLVAAPGIQVHAIWDDHDFAWNDAQGGVMQGQPLQADKVKISTKFMREFRRVLAAKDLTLFPSSAEDPAFRLDAAFTPLGATSIKLEPDGRSWLHLTDGRTHRKGRTLLGAAQREQLAQQFAAHPDALHIIASGSTFNQKDSWEKYEDDFAWLKESIGSRTWLMLSGDVHSTSLLTHKVSATGRLVELTASGAAVVAKLNPVITGPKLRNHGMLELRENDAKLDVLVYNKSSTSAVLPRRAGGELVAPD